MKKLITTITSIVIKIIKPFPLLLLKIIKIAIIKREIMVTSHCNSSGDQLVFMHLYLLLQKYILNVTYTKVIIIILTRSFITDT